MSRSRATVLAFFILALAVFFAAGGPRYFSFEYLKAEQAALEQWRAHYPWQRARSRIGRGGEEGAFYLFTLGCRTS